MTHALLAAALLAPLMLAPLVLAAPPARATTQDEVLSARLRTGWETGRGQHMAALQLDLAPGWKTYWRSPGDAGIPPQFDWSGSTNLKSVNLLWPAPAVFQTNGMQTIGYHDQLVLPIEVVAIDPARPVHLSAEIELGVCSDICMPASLSLSAEIAAPGRPDAAIKAALRNQPVPGAAAGLSGIACTVEPIADGLRLTARMALPALGPRETVAFETADPGVWVAEAVSDRQGGALVAMTELVPPSGQPFTLDRSAVTVTVISGAGAVEIAGCPAE